MSLSRSMPSISSISDPPLVGWRKPWWSWEQCGKEGRGAEWREAEYLNYHLNKYPLPIKAPILGFERIDLYYLWTIIFFGFVRYCMYYFFNTYIIVLCPKIVGLKDDLLGEVLENVRIDILGKCWDSGVISYMQSLWWREWDMKKDEGLLLGV